MMLKFLRYEYGSFLGQDQRIIEIRIKDGKLSRKMFRPEGYEYDQREKWDSFCEITDYADYLNTLEQFNFRRWKERYDSPILDGYYWELEYRDSDGEKRQISGNNSGPRCLNRFYKALTCPLDGETEKPGR